MGQEVSVSDIDKIISGLEKVNKSLQDLHLDLSTFKSDITGKVKGNQELITQQIESFKKESELKQELLQTQIENNKTEIVNNKGRISQIYDLDREQTKRNDDANAKILKDIDEKFDDFFNKIDPVLTSVEELKVKIKILWGGLGFLLATIIGVIAERAINGG